MKETHHIDKRSVYPSSPPECFKMTDFKIRIELKKGELIVVDRRIPTQTVGFSKKFISEHSSNSKTPMYPFCALTISFFKRSVLQPNELALRTIAYYSKCLVSDIRISGYIENTQRKGVSQIPPGTLEIENRNNEYPEDAITRKIIGFL
jgi:hypothetical protein